MTETHIAIVGGGPAGLMAAEMLPGATVYDSMPSVGRKFLMAGKGGMNITHSEPLAAFIDRYGEQSDKLAPLLAQFGPEQLRAWVKELGIDTFVGTSGRIFPTDMKAAPLLRAWLHRLKNSGVHFRMRHKWIGWNEDGALRFMTPEGEIGVEADAVVFALGGGSWARLGSDGDWVDKFSAHGIPVSPLLPANCGFDSLWSEHFRERFSGQPVKTVGLSFVDAGGQKRHGLGEFMITGHGIEGSLIYALSSMLRAVILRDGKIDIRLDLSPGKSREKLLAELCKYRGGKSLSNHLRSRAGIEGVKAGLIRELAATMLKEPEEMASAIKELPLTLTGVRPLDEAISSAGGVSFAALDEKLMLKNFPGIFCAGEMLDWEAPTGGYLLTACISSGRAAGLGVREWLQNNHS